MSLIVVQKPFLENFFPPSPLLNNNKKESVVLQGQIAIFVNNFKETAASTGIHSAHHFHKMLFKKLEA